MVFEKGVVENDAGKFMLYTEDGAEEIKIEKKDLAAVGGTGGNISDLGGYYNELLSFTEKAKKGEDIEDARLSDAVASLKFLLGKELSFHA